MMKKLLTIIAIGLVLFTSQTVYAKGTKLKKNFTL